MTPTLPILAMTTAAVALLAAPAAACPAPRHDSVTYGPTAVHDAAYQNVRTQVRIWTDRHGTTIRLRASGFPASATGKAFGAHVHVRPCGTDPLAAGGHYQHGTEGSTKDKEIWLDLTVDALGRAESRTERGYLIDPGTAGSVVVHAVPTDPGTGAAGGRLLCTSVPFGT